MAAMSMDAAPLLGGAIQVFCSIPPPLASQVKTRTLLGGDGALGAVCFLKSSPWMLFGLWALRCGCCRAAATACPQWQRRQLCRSGSVRVSSGALCSTGVSLVRRLLARRGSGSPPPTATAVRVVRAGASFLDLGPASSLLLPPWTPCCCLTGIFLLSRGSSVGSGDAVFLVKFLSHVGCALFLLLRCLLVASFRPCSRVSSPYVNGSAPFEPGEEAGASFDSGNGWCCCSRALVVWCRHILSSTAGASRGPISSSLVILVWTRASACFSLCLSCAILLAVVCEVLGAAYQHPCIMPCFCFFFFCCSSLY